MKFYNWKQDAIRDGKGFHVDVGAFSTPVAGGGASAVIDLDRPRGLISVPTLTTIIPIRVSVQCQTPLLATDADESEILVGVDITQVWDAAGAATAETALKMKVSHTNTSACTCKSIFTGNITTSPVLGMELARTVLTGDVQGTAANALWGKLDLLYEPLTSPIITGPAMLLVYWGGTVATTGFAQIEWIEYTTTDLA